jgi:hypothetical protein
MCTETQLYWHPCAHIRTTGTQRHRHICTHVWTFSGPLLYDGMKRDSLHNTQGDRSTQPYVPTPCRTRWTGASPLQPHWRRIGSGCKACSWVRGSLDHICVHALCVNVFQHTCHVYTYRHSTHIPHTRHFVRTPAICSEVVCSMYTMCHSASCLLCTREKSRTTVSSVQLFVW